MVDPEKPSIPLPTPTPTKPDSEPETTEPDDLSGEDYITIAENELEFFTLNGKEGGLKEWMPDSWERIAEYWKKANIGFLSRRTKDGVEYGLPYVLSRSLGRQFTKTVRGREVNVTLLQKYGNSKLPKELYTSDDSWTKFFNFYNARKLAGKAGFDKAPSKEEYQRVKNKYDSGNRGRSSSSAWSAAFINYCMLGDADFQILAEYYATPERPIRRGSHRGLYGESAKKNTKKLRQLAKEGIPWEEAEEQLQERGTWIWLSLDEAEEIGSKTSAGYPGLVGDIVMSHLGLKGGSGYHGDIRTAPDRIIGGNLSDTVKNRSSGTRVGIVTKNLAQIEKFYNTIYKAKQEK
jgi:hypothetical protein